MFVSSVIKCDYMAPPVHVYTPAAARTGEVSVLSRGEGLPPVAAGVRGDAQSETRFQVDT